ncbi:NUCLEAR FUSION DEFECTIVE 4-like [Olea europaea subsp. europaea]|uniref:NUCLEAR FUSION DEFECTIVE 4-like n=1 Tax=Olea europaea subsp. europaea TaxID=158383 RepID=A0A8S0VNQ2_OLEEU|nr:NUCLEAR FUSION DEFECTIVE 4-like [Olea europaea subsp. europaea]CAA3033086.1 NUCLEAR FUSION DEFECTIVE 4-like [Olea europaea subsp. europaea]
MVTVKRGSRPPWVGLGASIWMQIAAGNAYNFPLYSHSLKSVLGFNQRQLTMLGVANDIGENVGILPGLICNKFPPWVILLIGAFACFLGYGVLWLAISRTVLDLPYWLLWVALCIATNSNAWFSTAVLVTNMRNFPRSRGSVAGIIKGYGGLSAAVYTEIYSILLKNSSSKLMLFLALGIPTLCLMMMYFVRPCTPASGDDASENCHFLFILASSILLGIYVLTTTVLDDVLSISAPMSYCFLVLMVLFLMAPLAIPVKMTFFPSSSSKSATYVQFLGPTKSSDQDNGNADKLEPLLTPSSANLGSFHESDSMSDMDMLIAEGEGAIKKKRRPRRGDDFTFAEAMIKADFWLLFLVYFVGVGSGVTILNNLAQIGIAQYMHDTKILLSLFSFFNFVGRLGGGVISEYFVRSKAIPRTVWMTVTQVIMIITYLLFASALKGTLYAATALLGICYGVQFSIMVPTASELFGLKNFGMIFNFMSLGNPLGAYLFSGLLAGILYDNEASKQHAVSCLGPNCFRLTFLVLAGFCSVGTILSIVLSVRIKPVYQMLYAGGSFRLPQSSSH